MEIYDNLVKETNNIIKKYGLIAVYSSDKTIRESFIDYLNRHYKNYTEQIKILISALQIASLYNFKIAYIILSNKDADKKDVDKYILFYNDVLNEYEYNLEMSYIVENLLKGALTDG